MRKLILVLLAALIAIPALGALFGWFFMHLWNFAVVNALTIARPIDFWTAVCMMLFMGLWVAGSKSSK